MDILKDAWVMTENISLEKRYKLVALLQLAGFKVTPNVKDYWERERNEILYIAYNVGYMGDFVHTTHLETGWHHYKITYKELKTKILELLIPVE